MSEISDELRDFGTRLVHNASPFNCTFGDIRDYMNDIADHIDAGMVELPRDRDGVPIHVCDTVWTVKNGGKVLKVTSITLYGDVVAVDGVCEGCHAHVIPSDLTHTRPDSWERIADELEEWCGDVDVDGDACEKPRDLADRIRSLAEREG